MSGMSFDSAFGYIRHLKKATRSIIRGFIGACQRSPVTPVMRSTIPR